MSGQILVLRYMYLHPVTVAGISSYRSCTLLLFPSTYPLHAHNIIACTQSPSNQSFYRQIAGHQKGGVVSGVG